MTLTQLEIACIEGHRQNRETGITASSVFDEAEWIEFGMSALLHAGRLIRETRLLPMKQLADFKPDGSPVTKMEHEIETLVQHRLKGFCPDAVFFGEESAGVFPSNGIAIALDPVDGTWSLINRTETCATSLAGFQGGKPFLGMVLNPVTGELAYATTKSSTRLIQCAMFGEDDVACSLPIENVRPENILVNIHPQRHAKELIGDLYTQWQNDGLRMVKSPGGSPAWAMVEAAKGSFVYLNLWSQHPAEPYDLAAGVMVVRGAGGDVTDISGKPIDVLNHQGPFIAGIDKAVRNRVAAIAKSILKSSI